MDGDNTQLAVTTAAAIESLLRQPCLRIPLSQRAKFEGWLKIELAAALAHDLGEFHVRVEYQYQTKQGSYHFADLLLDLGSGQEALIMLKTVNTNFRFDYLEDANRPITNNIQGVLEDIVKLRDAAGAYTGWMLFPIYPVAALEADREQQLRPHMNKIRAACGGQEIAEYFVDREASWGIAWYLIQVL